MVCKVCPARRHCWDKGNCHNCEFGKAYISLVDKNSKLKAQNAELKKEVEGLKARIDTILNPEF